MIALTYCLENISSLEYGEGKLDRDWKSSQVEGGARVARICRGKLQRGESYKKNAEDLQKVLPLSI